MLPSADNWKEQVKQQDIFTELTALSKPLGADGDNLKLTIVRDGSAGAKQLSVGSMRKAEFAPGQNIITQGDESASEFFFVSEGSCCVIVDGE